MEKTRNAGTPGRREKWIRILSMIVKLNSDVIIYC